jgi:membrane fusion protein (multidrug efflux system)
VSQAIDAKIRSTSARGAPRLLRPILMLGGVALVAIGAGALWLQGGRVVSVDDAYIRAAKLAVSTDVSGIVATVAVKEGQRVHQGDLLFKLDDRPFRIALDGARAELAQTALDVNAMKQDYQRLLHATEAARATVAADQASFDRYANLVRGGGVTRAEYDDARFKLAADQQQVQMLAVQAQVQLARLAGDANIDPAQTPAYQRAQAKLDEARRELEHTTVQAPFDGITTQVDAVQPGMYLAAATPAFALVSTENVWAEGNPKETEITYVKPGDKVDVTVDTYPGQTWHGVVESIAPASGSEFSVLPAQNTSGNWVKVVQRIPLRVRLDRRPDGPELRAGTSVIIAIDTGHFRSLHDLY